MTDALCPWERQHGEPNRWYDRFERYRLAGPGRSLLGTVNAERTERGRARTRSVPQAWAKNAKQWQWRERAEAWDEHQRGQARAAHHQEVEEMNHRHIQEAKALQSKAFQKLKSLDLAQLSPADVLRYFVEAARLERTAHGEPESIDEQRLTGPEGGAVVFTIEDSLQACKELEQWHHERQPTDQPQVLPEADLEVP
jgi:hypothetical protein